MILWIVLDQKMVRIKAVISSSTLHPWAEWHVESDDFFHSLSKLFLVFYSCCNISSNNSFPSNTKYFNYIILKVHIKHIMCFGIFTAYQSLSTLICTSVFLLPETCLHVHFKNVMLKPIDVVSWEILFFNQVINRYVFFFANMSCSM